MKAHQPTIILCYPADEADWWFTQGNTRAIAERTYLMAIARDKARPPLYRIICQFAQREGRIDVHPTILYSAQRVSYELGQGGKGPKAVLVELIS